VINGKNTVYVQIFTSIDPYVKNWKSAKYVSKRKAELNKVNKVVFTLDGYDPKTFKKPVKGWKTYDFSRYSKKKLTFKGPSWGKKYSIKLYDKKGKLLKKGKGYILDDLPIELNMYKLYDYNGCE